MNRRAHRIGRGLTCLGLLSTGAYLSWRIATLPSQPPIWLVAVAIVVEIAGFVGSGLLTWALWHGPQATSENTNVEPCQVDVVVRVDQQPIHDVRATLLSLQSMATGRQVVVDLRARLEVAALAAEFNTVYAATDVDDHNGLKTCSAASSTPIFLLLDAGDIPSADAINRLLPMMYDDKVAVAIGQSLMADDDSAEHGPNGLHELTFERQTLNPALGARGAAILSDSGALIRRAAVDSVEVGDEQPIEAQAYWSMALMAEGWKVVAATGEPVLVRQVVQSQDAVYERRVLHARASRTMMFGPDGILRWNSLRLGQRLAIAASAVRPLSGLRRGGFIAVVVGSLLTGWLPLRPDFRVFAAVWAPGWMLTSLGLGLMSGWTLRPGDRTRWSLRNLGASWQGLRHPIAFDQRRAPIMTPHALQHGGALVSSVVVLSSVMMLRGLSEQWTHALGTMPDQWLAGLVAVSLWSLAMALDVLRMFGRRNQLRRAARVVTSIPAEVNDNPVAVFDVTALGAGFETNQEMSSKQRLLLDATITTSRLRERDAANRRPQCSQRVGGALASRRRVCRCPTAGHQSAGRVLHDRTGQAAAEPDDPCIDQRPRFTGRSRRRAGVGRPPGRAQADLADGRRRRDRQCPARSRHHRHLTGLGGLGTDRRSGAGRLGATAPRPVDRRSIDFVAVA